MTFASTLTFLRSVGVEHDVVRAEEHGLERELGALVLADSARQQRLPLLDAVLLSAGL